MFSAGELVRLKNDPSTVGTVGREPAEEVHGRTFLWIDFPTGRRKVPSAQLEAILAVADPFEDLKRGKLSAPGDLRRVITHLRMTGRLADMIYSLGATNTEFHAYQFKPVLKLLNSPSRGLLIADEVGLGKTIEAGLVWTELVARFDCRRLLIICPKPLCEKWRDELRSKFNVLAQIKDAKGLLQTLKDDSEHREGFAVIASMPSLRPPKGWSDPDEDVGGPRADLAEYLAEAGDDLFDLVVIDEAHHLRNTDTMNHQLGQLVTDVTDYSLFLSATPINLRANDLRALLKLIDPDTFEREWLFDMLQEENAPYVAAWEAARNPKVPMASVAALVADLPEGQVLKTGSRLERLREEFAKGVEDTPANRIKIAARLEEMSLLGSIINRTRRRDVAEFKVERRPQTARWEMTEAERDFYDEATARIEAYAYRHDINERFLLAQTQRLLASSLPAAYRHWGTRSGQLTLDEEDDAGSSGPIPGPLTEALGEICDDPVRLRALEANDTKFDRLAEWLSHVRGGTPDEKVIIFSSFRKSIAHLEQKLRAKGFEVLELHGGVAGDRQSIVNTFGDAPGGTILLTSEVGGEGLDLQFCRILFNWDLPWNPMKVEQRIGRIDRIGQQSQSIDIINLISKDTIEEQVYDRLYERLGIIRTALGDFEPILGDIIRDIEIALVNPELSVEQRAIELDRSVLAAEQRKAEAEELEREAPGLVAHGDSILQRINDAQAPHKRLTAADLRDYVSGILAASYRGTRIDRAANMEIEAYDIRLSAAAAAEFNQFRNNNARRYPTKFARETVVRCIFGSNPNPSRFRGVEAIPMTHPLSRFSAQMLDRKQGSSLARPVTALQIPLREEWGVPAGRYAIAIERWSVEGIVPVDKLAFVGAALEGQVALSEEVAERILLEALSEEPRLNLLPPDECLAAMPTVEELAQSLREARSDFENAEAARHYDLVDTQRSLIEEHARREQERAETQIREHRFSGSAKRQQLVYAVQGKFEKLMARLNLKLDEIQRREESFSYDEPKLVGLAIVDLMENA